MPTGPRVASSGKRLVTLSVKLFSPRQIPAPRASTSRWDFDKWTLGFRKCASVRFRLLFVLSVILKVIGVFPDGLVFLDRSLRFHTPPTTCCHLTTLARLIPPSPNPSAAKTYTYHHQHDFHPQCNCSPPQLWGAFVSCVTPQLVSPRPQVGPEVPHVSLIYSRATSRLLWTNFVKLQTLGHRIAGEVPSINAPRQY